METINLKTAITIRRKIGDRECAFQTKVLRGEDARGAHATKPEPKDLVPYRVVGFVMSDSSIPWFDLEPPILISILWSHVISVQQEEARV